MYLCEFRLYIYSHSIHLNSEFALLKFMCIPQISTYGQIPLQAYVSNYKSH